MTKETKEVATKEETAVSTEVASFDDGMGALDSNDFIIPRLIVAQTNSPVADEAKGHLYCDVTGDFQEKMTLVVVKLTKSRILFPEKYVKDNDPLCRSHDFIHPADDIEGATPMCDTCTKDPKTNRHKCDYANWGKGNAAPRCNEVWNMLVVDLETYLPMWFSVKSTALKPARKILSALKMRSTAKKVPMWGFSFDVGIATRVGDSGDSYIPTFAGLTQLEENEADDMVNIHNQLATVELQNSTTPDNDTGKSVPAAKTEEEEDF